MSNITIPKDLLEQTIAVLRENGLEYTASRISHFLSVPAPSAKRVLVFGLTLEHLNKNLIKVNRFKNVVIWSGQWQAWWRLGGGYTSDLNEAQVWDFNSAWNASHHCGPEKKIKYFEVICGSITASKP